MMDKNEKQEIFEELQDVSGGAGQDVKTNGKDTKGNINSKTKPGWLGDIIDALGGNGLMPEGGTRPDGKVKI